MSTKLLQKNIQPINKVFNRLSTLIYARSFAFIHFSTVTTTSANVNIYDQKLLQRNLHIYYFDFIKHL